MDIFTYGELEFLENISIHFDLQKFRILLLIFQLADFLEPQPMLQVQFGHGEATIMENLGKGIMNQG
jgi:hypothetical protein